MQTVFFFLLGLALLILGGEALVRGASRLATALGLSPLVVGLTVVAFSTSAPELAVTVSSAWRGQPDIAIGNIVGSNISNILLILGLSALVAPLIVSQQLVRVDVPLMLGASVLMLFLVSDGQVSSLEGGEALILLFLYVALAIVASRRETERVKREYADEFGAATPQARRRWPINALLAAVGVAMLVVGAQWLVDGAVAVARLLGLSELIIGLTIVAVGTSLPELATSVVATLRGERDIAVGNVVGSNIFNILSVLGLTALVAPNGIPVAPAAISFDIPIMIAVAAACLPVFFNGYRIERWEGALFLGYYVAYLAYLVLAATEHDALPLFSSVMLWFVIPLTALTLAVVTLRTVRERWLTPEREREGSAEP